jgi:hypothetical protein
LPIEHNVAPAIDLAWAAAFAADAADMGSIAHTKHLNATIDDTVMHEYVPAAINGNAAGMIELTISAAWAADCSHVAAIAVAQHLHSMITLVGYNYVACAVTRDAARTKELTSA